MKQARIHKLTQRDKLMAEDYRTMTLSELGKKYHMTYQNAHLRIKKQIEINNLNFTELVKYRRMHPNIIYKPWSRIESSEKGKKIIKAYKRGVTVKKLAVKYHLTPTTIYYKLHRYGIM